MDEAAAPNPNPMPNPPYSENNPSPVERQRAAMAKHQLRTNDLVMIGGHMRVQINGTPLIRLKPHELTVLLILASYARHAPGAPLGTKAMILAIERGNSWLASQGMSWLGATEQAVYQTIWRLREILRQKHLNVALIELLPNLGYRLSTPAMNIEIELIGSENLARAAVNALENKDFRG